MTSVVELAPRFSEQRAVGIVSELWGMTASARSLPSERDQNFRVSAESGDEFVLKIANAAERREVLEGQNAAMEHVAQNDPTVLCPQVCSTTRDEPIAAVQGPDGLEYFVRLLTYLPGTLLADVPTHTPELLHSLGRFMGRLDRALEGFSHPAVGRELYWDLRRADGVVRRYLDHIADRNHRAIVERMLLQFDAEAVPAMADLRRSVIHNDGNDYNLLVASAGGSPASVVGIIDFGDMVESHTVFDLAVAAAYALLGKDEPVSAVAPVVAGYHETCPLDTLEVDQLYNMITMRLCLSVAISAYQQQVEPANTYLRISESPAWEALLRLRRVSPRNASAVFRRACGMRLHDAAANELSASDIVAARRQFLGPNLSVHYDEPLKIVRGSRQYLYDEAGHAYLDAVNNVCHVGHCHPRVVRAAQQQIAVLNTNTRYLHGTIVQYAERLVATLPEPLRVCYFVCTGSEANDLALRLARTHTQVDDTVVVEGGYHGNTASLVEISPYKFDGPGGRGTPPHVHKVSMPDPYRGPHRGVDAATRYADEVREAVERLRGAGRNAAAFYCESLLGCGGQIVLPDGYLKEAYAHIRRAGGVCIADEVQVGFGRVGSHFWGFQTQGVVPDIVTLGKPMGNGHPLAAVITTPDVAASFDTGMEYFNTFGGNPVSCAIGMAVLDVIEEERLQANAQSVGRYLKEGLGSLVETQSLIGDVRGMGLFLGVELVRDRRTREPATSETAHIAERMKQEGVLIGTDGPFRNVLKIKPPLVFSEANADLLVHTLDRVLGESSL